MELYNNSCFSFENIAFPTKSLMHNSLKLFNYRHKNVVLSKTELHYSQDHTTTKIKYYAFFIIS